jgi:hypothetical protein
MTSAAMALNAETKSQPQRLGEQVRDLRAHHTDEHHRDPVDPRGIALRAQLRDERERQQHGHHQHRGRLSQARVDGQEVGTGFTDGGGHDLDDPETHCDEWHLVE